MGPAKSSKNVEKRGAPMILRYEFQTNGCLLITRMDLSDQWNLNDIKYQGSVIQTTEI
jgi:hypothetical protein